MTTVLEGEFYTGGHLRWNLGWPTPNYAGALLAMLLGLGFALTGTRWRWAWLVAEAALLFLLVKTYSRGALTAWGAAWLFGCVVRCGWRPAERPAWLARAALTLALLLAVDFQWFRAASPATGAEAGAMDGSVTNRIELWRGGLQMLAAAPASGWGAGEAGRAYMNWFQAPDRTEGYATLVNSYLHVAAEYGLPALAGGLFLVVLAWGIATSEARQRARDPIKRGEFDPALGAGAALLAWAVVNLFSTLWIESRLWTVPAVAVGLIFRPWRIAETRRHLRLAGLTAAGFTLLTTAGLYGAGRWLSRDAALSAEPLPTGAVAIGAEIAERQEWHVWPDEAVLGAAPGKELRRWLEDETGRGSRLVVWRSGLDNPASAQRVMLFGRQAARIGREKPIAGEELWVVHPTVPPPEAPLLPPAVTVLLPQIDETGGDLAWREWATRHRARLLVSPGCGTDIRSCWPAVMKTALAAPRSP